MENPIHAIADPDIVIERLDMDVAGLLLDSLDDDKVNQLDHGSLPGLLGEQPQVSGPRIIDGLLLDLHLLLVHVVEKIIDHLLAAIVDLGDRLANRRLGREHRPDLTGCHYPDVVQLENIEGIRDRQCQHVGHPGYGYNAIIGGQVLRQKIDDALLRPHLEDIHCGESRLLAQDLQQVGLAQMVTLEQDLCQRTGFALRGFHMPGKLILADHIPAGENIPKPLVKFAPGHLAP